MAEQKVALITGGARRVGRGIVERLSQAGFKVAFTFNNSQLDADTLAKQTAGLAIKADFTDSVAAVKYTHQKFTENFDRLDILVNNASLYLPGKLNAVDVDQSRKLMAIHFESPLLLCRHFAGMLRASRGHIINMVDLMAEKPGPGYLAYTASKAALMNLTLSLARELAPEITVNGIAPGVVDWPPGYTEAEKQKYLQRVPLARAGTPADVAEAVLYLATAGAYLTGQIIRLDGGRSIT